MTVIISNIKYDTDGEKVRLPKTLTMTVPDDTPDDEIDDLASDFISDETGYCHFGFTTDRD